MIYVSIYNSIKETLKNEPQPPAISAFFIVFPGAQCLRWPSGASAQLWSPRWGWSPWKFLLNIDRFAEENNGSCVKKISQKFDPKMGHTGIPHILAMFIEDNDENDENGPIFRWYSNQDVLRKMFCFTRLSGNQDVGIHKFNIWIIFLKSEL